MAGMSGVKEDMEVIGADGVHIGTVDRVENNRIKLTKADSGEGSHKGHHHYIDGSLVAEVEGDRVRYRQMATWRSRWSRRPELGVGFEPRGWSRTVL